ncbi:zeta toxin family protein [Stratiformator vulcanicus]|uniref:zeta toxin family protein n=1 Tax=Stratiformator vulcanicus TaxID=2527980 RepID=UPI002877956C|nr:zeta toxin family protein [Stratiformator vulcanicus]
MAENRPRILIIAGPNGAGKTTFAKAYLGGEFPPERFVNADEIAASLPDPDSEATAIRAGIAMLQRLDQLAEQGVSFAFETTLSGRTYAKRIVEWKANGYRVELLFLTLSTVEEAVLRVRQRVLHGGHNIPEETIRRRYRRGLDNFDYVYKGLVDYWTLYDNSKYAKRKLAEGPADE